MWDILYFHHNPDPISIIGIIILMGALSTAVYRKKH
jgi:hypothetical protein